MSLNYILFAQRRTYTYTFDYYWNTTFSKMTCSCPCPLKLELIKSCHKFKAVERHVQVWCDPSLLRWSCSLSGGGAESQLLVCLRPPYGQPEAVVKLSKVTRRPSTLISGWSLSRPRTACLLVMWLTKRRTELRSDQYYYIKSGIFSWSS